MPKGARLGGYINPKPILAAKERAVPRILVRQATYFRKAVRRSIVLKSRGKSKIGRPPYTHNKLLRNSIQWALERHKDMAVVGPSFRIAGIIGHTHEFGGLERDNRIPGARRKVKGRLFINGVHIDANWKMQVGGHGPIRIDAGGSVYFTKFVSHKQVARSRNLAVTAAELLGKRVSRAGQHAKPRRYPKRPFMKPKLRSKAIQRGLTKIYKDSIGPSGVVSGAGRIGV